MHHGCTCLLCTSNQSRLRKTPNQQEKGKIIARARISSRSRKYQASEKKKNHYTSKNHFQIQIKKTPNRQKKEKSPHLSPKIRSWTAHPPNSFNTTIAAVPHKTEILNCSSPLTRYIPQLLHCSSPITSYASRLHLLDLYRLPPFLR